MTTPTPTTTPTSGAADLRTAAQAVVDRWDTPIWKDVPATAEYIGRLRAALAAGQATAAQPAPATQQAGEVRPVTPYTCPKCHALWLHCPAEQTGFGRDTLNCRSADHCHYCEKAGVEQLQRLERIPAALHAPAQPATQQWVAYAALPTHSHAGRVYEEGFLIGTCPLYTADKMRAFADATHAIRASHGQAPYPAAAPAQSCDCSQGQVCQVCDPVLPVQEAEREAFEAWFSVKLLPMGHKHPFMQRNSRGEYNRGDTAARWEAWQARASHGQAPAGAVPLDEARRLFDAGWKAAALLCDREDVVADGIIGFGACPQFEEAFRAARKQGAAMATDNWEAITETRPAQGVAVLTKIDGAGGPRNTQVLVRKGNLWFFPDMSMYVYYTPTHFKEQPHGR